VGWEERDVDGGGARGGGGGRGWWRWVGVHTISNLLPLNPSPLPGRLGRAAGHPFLASRVWTSSPLPPPATSLQGAQARHCPSLRWSLISLLRRIPVNTYSLAD
jgi:hypothetical protein